MPGHACCKAIGLAGLRLGRQITEGSYKLKADKDPGLCRTPVPGTSEPRPDSWQRRSDTSAMQR